MAHLAALVLLVVGLAFGADRGDRSAPAGAETAVGVEAAAPPSPAVAEEPEPPAEQKATTDATR